MLTKQQRKDNKGGKSGESEHQPRATPSASLLLLLGPLLLGGRGLLGAARNGNDGHGRGCLDHAHEMAVPAVVLGQLCAHTNGAAKQGRGATAAGLRPPGSAGRAWVERDPE